MSLGPKLVYTKPLPEPTEQEPIAVALGFVAFGFVCLFTSMPLGVGHVIFAIACWIMAIVLFIAAFVPDDEEPDAGNDRN